jgi:hypothetical protein
MPSPDRQTAAMLQAVLDNDMQSLSELAGGGRIPPLGLPPRQEQPSYDPMEQRVTRLETHMEYVRRDLELISGKLDTVLDRTNDLPTRSDLTTFRWQWVATAVAAIALIVGGIIGGLGWIKPDSAPAAPVVYQLPAAAIAPSEAPASGVKKAG